MHTIQAMLSTIYWYDLDIRGLLKFQCKSERNEESQNVFIGPRVCK